MRNMITITILFSIIAIILLAGCLCQTLNNVVQRNVSNKSVAQSNVSNASVTTLVSNASNASAAACSDKQCFVSAANACGKETIQINEDYGVVNYSTSNCVLNKTIISLNQNESTDIKRLVEGKSMLCRYENGAFDQNWINSLVFGIEKCEGELRDVLGQLIVFT